MPVMTPLIYYRICLAWPHNLGKRVWCTDAGQFLSALSTCLNFGFAVVAKLLDVHKQEAGWANALEYFFFILMHTSYIHCLRWITM